MNSNDKIYKKGNTVYHESAGGFVFYIDDKTGELFVALIKTLDNEGLFIPKGHLKDGENPLDAAEREVMEELSLQNRPKFISELGIDEYTFKVNGDNCDHNKKVHLFVFESINKEEIKPPEDENIIEVMWFRVSDALDMISYYRDYLIVVMDKLIQYHK